MSDPSDLLSRYYGEGAPSTSDILAQMTPQHQALRQADAMLADHWRLPSQWEMASTFMGGPRVPVPKFDAVDRQTFADWLEAARRHYRLEQKQGNPKMGPVALPTMASMYGAGTAFGLHDLLSGNWASGIPLAATNTLSGIFMAKPHLEDIAKIRLKMQAARAREARSAGQAMPEHVPMAEPSMGWASLLPPRAQMQESE